MQCCFLWGGEGGEKRLSVGGGGGLRNLHPPCRGETLGEQPLSGVGGVPPWGSLAGCVLGRAVSRLRAPLACPGMTPCSLAEGLSVTSGLPRSQRWVTLGERPSRRWPPCQPRARPRIRPGAFSASPGPHWQGAAPACLFPPPALLPGSPSRTLLPLPLPATAALPQRQPLGPVQLGRLFTIEPSCRA